MTNITEVTRLRDKFISQRGCKTKGATAVGLTRFDAKIDHKSSYKLYTIFMSQIVNMWSIPNS